MTDNKVRIACMLAVLPALPVRGGDVTSIVPDWVRPGFCLTYDLLTGSVAGSLNGIELNENGELYTDGRRYVTEREGHASHGIVRAIVAGLDSQVVALDQVFFLIAGVDSVPMMSSHQDMMVSSDSGGDLWMHPRKQAQTIREHPWTAPRPGSYMARATTWRSGAQSWAATCIVSLGDTGKTFWVYDQATGRLLYLSRVTRTPPTYRDPNSRLPDAPSYATFLRFMGARQLHHPWVNTAMPEWTRQLHTLSYRGQSAVEFPGSIPAPQALSQTMEVERNGGNWILFRSHVQSEGQIMPSDARTVTGTGSLLPYVIPPAALGGLRPGQEIDRDPQTGYAVSVAGADPQTVTLQFGNPRQIILLTYDRAQGLLIRTSSREHSTAGTNMFLVRQMQLVAKR